LNKREVGDLKNAAGRIQGEPIFVVQEHDASRLHYDFRLGADGVLKSWAVPKVPSMDPAQKRLAVHVEDHPLDYANFEGAIPAGQYGAGTVSIWDRGTYENLSADKPDPESITQGIESGQLEFALHGAKLKGKFALVRMRRLGRGKDNWLLIKMKDDMAGPVPDSKSSSRTSNGAQKKTMPSLSKTKSRKQSAHDRSSFTHLDKVMFPDVGITKGGVIEFYRRIAPRLLPFLRDRPATLERLPEGIGNGKTLHFWQKNIPETYPDWIMRVDLPTEQGKSVHYALVNDLETLLYLVNQGTLTFHIWFSRMQDLDRPDFVLFDLDPGHASFGDVVDVARELHAILNDEGVDSFPKTSGKTGLHVLVPWTAAGGYDAARGWALRVGERVVQNMPSRATVERSKAKRGGRVYVDVMQNARGHHAVPPYVLRAVPGAPVSMPLHWREIKAGLRPTDFNIRGIFSQLSRRKHDPMAALTAFFETTTKSQSRADA
jgi:bifunctional non-homologous end joining protein LigD